MKQGLIFLVLFGGAAIGAKPVKIVHKSSALEFSYEWPAQVAGIPVLDAKFRAQMGRAYREALGNARADEKVYREQQRDGVSDFYVMKWIGAGETARLLSLQNELSTFTGGAHPNTSYDALVWDRKLNQTISMEALATAKGQFDASTRSIYCKALDTERRKRREGEKLDLQEFNECPKYSDLAIAPVDRNRNGRFETVDFVASPYVAGPYAEGEYEISLPVTARLVARLKPEYRGSFEVQRQ
jgi:hypothetical protein